jgi:nitric oxide reductase NorD protein
LDEVSHHRITWRRRLGTEAEALPRTSYDGEILRLPSRLAVYPGREANGALYLWLAAAAAHLPDPVADDDPLCADLRALHVARQVLADTLADAPGLKGLYEALSSATLHQRSDVQLPKVEAQIEAVIRHMLGADLPGDTQAIWQAVTSGELGEFTAPRKYRPFRPVPLWPELRKLRTSAGHEVESRDTDGPPEEADSKKTHRARRRKSDQAERADSLILHKFEALLSWAEFLNLNRRVDDDDPDNAKKAADEQEEIGLGQISKAPATRLKLHLDLAPEDVDR